jgi:hypothetical protein
MGAGDLLDFAERGTGAGFVFRLGDVVDRCPVAGDDLGGAAEAVEVCLGPAVGMGEVSGRRDVMARVDGVEVGIRGDGPGGRRGLSGAGVGVVGNGGDGAVGGGVLREAEEGVVNLGVLDRPPGMMLTTQEYTMNAFHEHHKDSIRLHYSVLRPDSVEWIDTAVPATEQYIRV